MNVRRWLEPDQTLSSVYIAESNTDGYVYALSKCCGSALSYSNGAFRCIDCTERLDTQPCIPLSPRMEVNPHLDSEYGINQLKVWISLWTGLPVNSIEVVVG